MEIYDIMCIKLIRSIVLKIPFYSREEHSRALLSVVERAAHAAATHPETMARMMTHLLEELSFEVARGNPVRIPGFGLFSPVVKQHKTRGTSVVRVYFYPSRAFSNDVDTMAPTSQVGRRVYENFQKRHHPGSAARHRGQSVSTSMRSWREHLTAKGFGRGPLDDSLSRARQVR